jgi:polyhydroxybutyrate depolymerase
MRNAALTLVAALLVLSTPPASKAIGAASAACGSEQLAAGRQSIEVLSSGHSRSVLLFVPTAVSAAHSLPLVIDLHGSGGNGEGQARSSQLGGLGEAQGFVVANPSGGVFFPTAPDRHYWNIPGVPLAVGPTPADAPDDVQFIGDMIGQIAAKTCIDPRRIFVTGMSGGARMTSLLACQLSTRIAAIAPVAGLRAGLPLPSDPTQPDPGTCIPERAMPIVTFHGTGDATNPFNGGGTPYWAYSIPTALERWSELDHCQGKPSEQRITAHVTLLRYEHCSQGAAIWLYRIDAAGAEGGGHSWPGSTAGEVANNRPSTEIKASELMWKFFQAHPLPAEYSHR